MNQITIEFMSGPLDGCIVQLPVSDDETAITIGRAEDCDVVIPYDHRVSRHHARVTVREEQCFLADTASRNGTWWDEGEPVVGEVALPVGALFRVGQTRLRVREVEG